MRFLLKIGLTGFLGLLAWVVCDQLLFWLFNLASDLAILAGYGLALLSAAVCVTLFKLIWKRELTKCANLLGL